MFFTQEDYIKIQQWLVKNSVKDTEFNEANIPFNGEETITIVQGNQNKKVFLKDLVSQIFNLGISDFVNITDKYDAPNISLEEAIRLIPSRARKEGQVITFLDRENHWHIYQFKGVLNQWNVLDTWEDLFDWEKLIIDSILPDEEDLTKSPADENGNSYLSLKDRAYNPEDFSGLGRIILRKNIVEVEDPIYGKVKKNILYQDMINKSNTIYEIRYDYDLQGQNITIPEGCILDFQGGSFDNGTIHGNNTFLKGEGVIFFNIIIKGNFYNLDESFFYNKDFNTFKYCIENNLNGIVDFKGRTFVANAENITSNYIRRGNCEIKNFNIEVDESSNHIFVLLRFLSDNISLTSFSVNGNNKCTRCISFENSKYANINNGIIENVGNNELEVTVGLEFTGDCSFANIQNVTINNVQAKNNSSGISISKSESLFSSFIKIDNCYITNINSPSDADGIKVLEFIDVNNNIIHQSHHSFTNIVFENCDKRGLKLECSYPFVKNITCKNGYFGQGCVDFFSDYIILDGLYTENLLLTTSLNCIFLHDYVKAYIKNINAIGNNVTFDKFNALIFDKSGISNSILTLENIKSDYNVIVRNNKAGENKTLNINNLYHIAGYHYSMIENAYTKVLLENLYIDKSKLNNYWWSMFENLPIKLISKSYIFDILPQVYIDSEYKTLGYTSLSKEKLTTLVNNGKKLTIGNDTSFPTQVYYKYYNIDDEIDLPIGKIRCIVPPSDEDKVGKWNVVQTYSKDATELNEFINNPTIYNINFNMFGLYDKSFSKRIDSEGWYAIAELFPGSTGFVTISKNWSNGEPSPSIVAYSYGAFSDIKLIHGLSNYGNNVKFVRINKIDSKIYLEVKYIGNLDNQNHISITNTTYDTKINDIIPSIGDGEIIKEIDISPDGIVHTSGDFESKPTSVNRGFAYFCSDRKSPEGTSNGIMIYHKGENIWVDALGRIIE